MKAFIRADDYGRGVSLFLGQQRRGGGTDAVITIDRGMMTMEFVGQSEQGPPPLLRGDAAQDVVQAILDAAWSHGMRPTGVVGERGEIARLEGHLADMRAIAFGATKIKTKPE